MCNWSLGRGVAQGVKVPMFTGVGGDSREANMAHLVDKHLLERANTVLLLGILWGGLAACALGAMVYDVALWLGAW
jgi:hypothetical protein